MGGYFNFHCEDTINKTTCCFITLGMLVFLRVYTVDKNTRDLVVIGSCLFKLFTLEVGL